MQTDVLVIGAGLSGLAASRALVAKHRTVKLLEARDRVGGRAFSLCNANGAMDLGPAWIWPRFQPLVTQLAADLGLELVPQYETGDFVFETHSGMQRGPFPKRYADARRVRAGAQALASGMAEALPASALRLGEAVHSIEQVDDVVRVMTDRQTYSAHHLICAVPGPLLCTWNFSPTLPRKLSTALTRWPTWMAAQAKIMAVYDSPFWRRAGLSGAAASHLGPLIEVADQSDIERGLYALFGFVGLAAQERQRHQDTLRDRVIEQLVRLFGKSAAHPVAFHLHDWAREPFTAAPSDLSSTSAHPPYGEPAWSGDWYHGRIFFAGAESASTHGGLIEGALISAERAVAQVLGASNARLPA